MASSPSHNYNLRPRSSSRNAKNPPSTWPVPSPTTPSKRLAPGAPPPNRYCVCFANRTWCLITHILLITALLSIASFFFVPRDLVISTNQPVLDSYSVTTDESNITTVKAALQVAVRVETENYIPIPVQTLVLTAFVAAADTQVAVTTLQNIRIQPRGTTTFDVPVAIQYAVPAANAATTETRLLVACFGGGNAGGNLRIRYRAVATLKLFAIQRSFEGLVSLNCPTIP
ncbi:hypothetical protein DFJ77DRAFT_475957 [Powellomyces hirtus]|nr:hypothetical protein DFJ77DRAFT_475957 [Powellomyces hirtus]